jgi:hypothetical protein
MKSFTIAAAATALFVSSVSAQIDPIVIKGSKFFYKTNGTQFFMKGVAYQQEVGTNTTQTEAIDYVDPLADEAVCNRDIPFLQELQTNTIRVYAIDPTKDHKACMDALAQAGIYVIADLSEPGTSIIRDDPSWSVTTYARYTAVIDELAQFDNTLGFFAGNEVSNQVNNTHASAFVKAAVRDSKRYIKERNYRPMGVGYATNDDKEIRENLADYFDCGSKEDSIDFWGYNIYSWCGESSFQESGYDVRTEEFKNFDVPVFFAEYGCNTPRPRPFTDVGALYGDEMTDVWSGGIVYMYYEEANEFGLVTVDNNRVSRLPDFTALSSQIAKIDPTGVRMNDYNPQNTAKSACPSVGREWEAQATPLPPSPNSQLCDCMYETLSCVVADNIDEEDYGDLFSVVCGLNDDACAGIAKNATTGDYGAYGMCGAKEQLGFALNQYANAQRDGNGCNFSGSASAKSAVPTRSVDSNCRALMSQAGSAGTGTVTSVPTGANGAAASSSRSPGAGVAMSVPHFETGRLQLGIYVAAALLSGGAMVLL